MAGPEAVGFESPWDRCMAGRDRCMDHSSVVSRPCGTVIRLSLFVFRLSSVWDGHSSFVIRRSPVWDGFTAEWDSFTAEWDRSMAAGRHRSSCGPCRCSCRRHPCWRCHGRHCPCHRRPGLLRPCQGVAGAYGRWCEGRRGAPSASVPSPPRAALRCRCDAEGGPGPSVPAACGPAASVGWPAVPRC